MGRGLALRLSLIHDVFVGSRRKERAERVEEELSKLAHGFYQRDMQGSIRGCINVEALKNSEIVIATLPPDVAAPFLSGLSEEFTSRHILVSTVVPMERRGKLYYWTPLMDKRGERVSGISAAEVIQDAVGEAEVVSAFQTIPAAYLNNIDSVLNLDVLIAGDDDLALSKVSSIIRDIPNLRPLRVGPLENSQWIEPLTPLLINAAILNGLHEPSIRIVPWMPT